MKDTFDIERMERKYCFKEENINLKVSNLKHNIFTHRMKDGRRIDFALINIAVMGKLKNTIKSEIVELLGQSQKEKEVSFI